MDNQHSESRYTIETYAVIAILLASILLRWALVFRGGQYFFSDEQRYQISQEMTELLLRGQAWEAASRLFSAPEHLGYKVIGILPALLEHIIGQSLVLPAMFFSLFSTLNLYLIFLLSKRVGASAREALFALTFSALSQCLFFYVRHFLPYDVSMTFGLLALYVGLTDRESARRSLVCGALSFLCFVTYNGYWSLAALAMLVHASRRSETMGNKIQRGVSLGLGLILPLFALIACAAPLGIDLLEEYTHFAQTITEGNFEEGWSLPFAYFWHTENFLILVLVLLALYAVFKRRNYTAVVFWGSCILFLYLCLAVPSVFLHAFVVYGRLVRPIMPFLVLLSANGLMSLAQDVRPAGQRIAPVLVLVVLIRAAWNFNTTFHVAFPRDFVREVQAQYPDFNFSPKRFAFGAPEVCENNGYAMQNAKFFLAAPETTQVIPGEILLSAPHPINFLPYQDEGYTPEQKQTFRKAQLRMVFYKLDPDYGDRENLKKMGVPSCLTG